MNRIGLDWSHQQRQAQEINPHPGIIRFRERIAKYGGDPEVHKELRRKRELGANGNTTKLVETSHNAQLSDG